MAKSNWSWVLLVLLLSVLGCNSSPHHVSVYYDEQSEGYEVLDGLIDTAGVAWGSYEDTLNAIGWQKLEIHTNANFDDNVQMHAAGVIEGYLLWDRISQHRNNLWEWYKAHYLPGHEFSPALLTFMQENLDYTRQNVKDNKDDPYWQHVGYVMAQFDGLVDGYHRMSNNLTEFDLWLFNAAGDVLDLGAGINSSNRVRVEDMTEEEILNRLMANDHCTGFVRITDDDLFVSQDAWFFFGAMNRVFKQYDFQLTHPGTKARKISLSSYPGILYSFDDFYVTDAGLAFLETTNDIANPDLYDLITYKCVLEWVRARVASQMGDSGKLWSQVFKKQNSGSYNNQWLIVDFKHFVPGTQPSHDLLWCLEQIPGYVEFKDITDVLVDQGYFPSYNIPYFENIYNMSGYPSLKAKSGDFWSYEKCSRAQIFRRDANKVFTLDDMKRIMRYNDYQNDPLSLGDPGNAICSRYDLKKAGQPRFEMFGGLDTKITSFTHAKNLTVFAISSPTYDQQPVWQFSTAALPVPHEGLPNRYDFPWMTFKWGGFWSSSGDDHHHHKGNHLAVIIGSAAALLCVTLMVISVVIIRRNKRARRDEEKQRLVN